MDFNFSTINDFRINPHQAEKLRAREEGLGEISYQVFRYVTLGERRGQIIVDLLGLLITDEGQGVFIDVAWNTEDSEAVGYSDDDYQVNAYGLDRKTIAQFWIPERHQSNVPSVMNVIAKEIFAHMDFSV